MSSWLIGQSAHGPRLNEGVIRKVQFTVRPGFGSAGLALLCHCSEEMHRLVTVLPELYEMFGADDVPA